MKSYVFLDFVSEYNPGSRRLGEIDFDESVRPSDGLIFANINPVAKASSGLIFMCRS